jgi:hypothetical protein
LLKLVLESQSIYWMAVELIPKFIISRSVKCALSSCGMEILLQVTSIYAVGRFYPGPKSTGGWGLRNLTHFNTVLLENTLWHTLFCKGIWHNIVLDKYIRHSDVIKWFRSANFEHSKASRIWRNLLKSIHLLTHWHSWLSGSGETNLYWPRLYPGIA